MILYCATTNPGKLREFRLAAEKLGRGRVDIQPLAGIESIPPPVETGDTFEANAVQKAEYYSPHAPGLLFAEDSGLEVDALGGAPGVFSARFAGPGATDAANNRLLLEKLRGIQNRTARYICVIALCESGRLIRTFRGAVEGRITDEAHGSNGFGYDPLFYYGPFGSTFGQVTGERKLEVSHRGRAVGTLIEWVESVLGSR